MPLITVLPNKFVGGLKRLHDEVDVFEPVEIQDAFDQKHTTDAHFVCYFVEDPDDGPVGLRLQKEALGPVLKGGGRVMATCLCYDIDNPSHARWTEETLVHFLELIDRLDSREHVGMWSHLYTTQSGARLVYTLSEPLSVMQADLVEASLFQLLTDAGIAPDVACMGWSRLYRLPRVIRDGKNTETSPYFVEADQDKVLDASLVPALNKKIQRPSYEAGDCPDPFESSEMLEELDPKSGRMRATPFAREARRRLSGRNCFGCIFMDEPMAAEGHRDATLTSYVGQAVAMLYSNTAVAVTPEHIYALFVPAVQEFEPDGQTPNWFERVWSIINRMWEKEESHQQSVAEDVEDATEDAVGMCDNMWRRILTWTDDESLIKMQSEDQFEWINKHLIASMGHQYYLMRRDGYYDPMSVNEKQLIARIRTLGMDKLIETRNYTPKGEPSNDVSANSIINKHATIVSGVIAKPQIGGAVLQNPDTHNAQLVIESFSRNHRIEPVYDPEVDTWMRLMFGAEYYMWACKWIGWALAFEEGPICALSICAGQGIGKKLLTEGLAECLSVPCIATAKDIVDKHQYGLMASPFLVINEGWPKQQGYSHPADTFRSLVSGDAIFVDRKYQAPVRVHNPVRVLLTANNMTAVSMLTSGKDLSPEDRQALAIRLQHMDLSSDAAVWFQENGGTRMTGKPGRRWIRGDGNEPSDYIVAKHFMWLYVNRGEPTGTRLLMEGSTSESLMFELRLNSGNTPLVLECMVKLVESTAANDGVVIREDGSVYFLMGAVMDYYRRHLRMVTQQTLTMQAVRHIMHSLCSSTSKGNYILDGGNELGPQRWIQVDCHLLYMASTHFGWKAPKLSKIIERVLTEKVHERDPDRR